MLKHLITLLLTAAPLLAQTVGYNVTTRSTSPADLNYRGGNSNTLGGLAVTNTITASNIVATAGFTAPNNSIALGTKTTGNYAAGDAEAGAATSGDSATAFFASGTLEDARLPASMANKTFTGTFTVPNDTIALGTKTTGNYAAGDAEAGAATSGDSATAFFSAGTIETARLGSGTANSSTFLRGDSTWATPAGSGDFVGPASSADNAFVRFDGTTGKLGQNSSGSTLDDSGNAVFAGTVTAGSAAGFSLTGSNGTVTFLGTGDGQDEDFKIDLNGTANTAVFTSTTSMATWDFGTSWVFKLGTIELGHATANTLSAASGVLSIEGQAVFAANTKADVLEAGFFASDAGANDTYTATLSPAITAYVTGARYRFKANTANTGAATLNLNGLGAKTIKKAAGGITTDLADNDIRAGQWCDVVYDGTNLQLQSTLGNAAAGSGTVTSVGWTGGIVSIATATTTPAFTIAGTSGGVPYFSSSSAWASSAALAANALVVGGGAGVAPSTVTTGAGNLTALALAANAAGGFVTDNGTATFTGKTYDASATGNTLKQTKYLNLQRPDYGDGAGAVPQTNTFNVSGLMHYTLSGNAETNANWIVYEFDCPPDLDTTVAMTARFAFLSGGTDADDYVFHLTYNQVAAGTAYPTGTGINLLPIVMTVTPTTAANGDLQYSAATTLTGWAAALTAGRTMQVRVARLQNTQDDGARDVQLVITYGSTL